MTDRTTDGEDAGVYQVVAARRLHLDAQLWQVPALNLAAQAFLFTIALGPDSEPVARVISAGLSVISSALSMLLMAKHRLHQDHDSIWLDEYEERHGLARVHSVAYFQRRNGLHRFVPRSLYVVWQAGLGLFLLAGLAVIVLTVIDAGTLAGS